MPIEILKPTECGSLLSQYLPELFGPEANSSLKEGLLSAHEFSAHALDLTQPRFYFTECAIGGQICNAELTIYHNFYVCHNASSQKKTIAQALVEAQKEREGKKVEKPKDQHSYDGWRVQIIASSPLKSSCPSGSIAQTLHITWEGKDMRGPSDHLVIGRIDFNGHGPKIAVDSTQMLAAYSVDSNQAFDDLTYDGANVHVPLKNYPGSDDQKKELEFPLQVSALTIK
jgi:hypothetical protein